MMLQRYYWKVYKYSEGKEATTSDTYGYRFTINGTKSDKSITESQYISDEDDSE